VGDEAVAQMSGMITKLFATDAQRTTKVAAITAEMTTVLAPYAIRLISAITDTDCNYAILDEVAFVFDYGATGASALHRLSPAIACASGSRP